METGVRCFWTVASCSAALIVLNLRSATAQSATELSVARIWSIKGGEHPRFSPDGKRIVFELRREIFVADIDGKGRQRIASSDEGGCTQPVWLPDGRRIAFMRGANGGVTIFDLILRKEFRLVELGYAAGLLGPDPDGKGLMVQPIGGLHRLDLDTLAVAPVSPEEAPRLKARLPLTAHANQSGGISWGQFEITILDPSPGINQRCDELWIRSPDHRYRSILTPGCFSEAVASRTDGRILAAVGHGRDWAGFGIFRLNESPAWNVKYMINAGSDVGVVPGKILNIHLAQVNPLNQKVVGVKANSYLGSLRVVAVDSRRCLAELFLRPAFPLPQGAVAVWATTWEGVEIERVVDRDAIYILGKPVNNKDLAPWNLQDAKPVRVIGKWKGTVECDQGKTDYSMELNQRGELGESLEGDSEEPKINPNEYSPKVLHGSIKGSLVDRKIKFSKRYTEFNRTIEYDGIVAEDGRAIQGSCSWTGDEGEQTGRWSAVRD